MYWLMICYYGLSAAYIYHLLGSDRAGRAELNRFFGRDIVNRGLWLSIVFAPLLMPTVILLLIEARILNRLRCRREQSPKIYREF